MACANLSAIRRRHRSSEGTASRAETDRKWQPPATVFDPSGKVVEYYHKVQLAEPWPTPGDHLSVFPFDGVPSSIIICRDERGIPNWCACRSWPVPGSSSASLTSRASDRSRSSDFPGANPGAGSREHGVRRAGQRPGQRLDGFPRGEPDRRPGRKCRPPGLDVRRETMASELDLARATTENARRSLGRVCWRDGGRGPQVQVRLIG
jgi:hypothetical protein